MLAAFSTQTHPYPLQLLTFLLALIPIALLVLFLTIARIFRRRAR